MSSLPVANPKHHFRLADGQILKSLRDLYNSLEEMDSSIFSHHVNEYKNDFGNWIHHVFENKELADSIFKSKTKEEIMRLISDYLISIALKDKNKVAVKKVQKSLKLNQKEMLADKKQPSKAKKDVKNENQSALEKRILEKQRITLEKIDEILQKEKELERREEKIVEIEARIEKQLGNLAKSQEHKFFTKDFLQGLAVGILILIIGFLVYTKFL